MRTGILGGTFNPIHLGHLRIAEQVQRRFHLDRTLFIPAAQPPHKEVAGAVSFDQRLAMVRCAVQGHPGFAVSDLEKHRSGKSFSVDTLEILQRDDPGGERFFIIGLDSYRDIASWKQYPRLFELCHLVVVTRPGVNVGEPLAPLPVDMHGDFCYDDPSDQMRHKSGNFIFFLNDIEIDISSTQIRHMISMDQPIRHLVPPGVADYIVRHGLYRAKASSPRSL